MRTKRTEVDRSLLDDLQDEDSHAPTSKIPPIKVMHPTAGPRALELDSEGKMEFVICISWIWLAILNANGSHFGIDFVYF